ncbi:cytochrome c [Neolewinella aurantiaca]|uniref:Cytochrome c n=1 Tax=Neolewinella aurantiaca TaxID=2602767 RepID=A0A5C7FS79_9BACT|nr:cytochrome c [Neolewinella aurantiaca]TXF87555.1 cytochrome c [Neolewinella aurantiaca]
MKDLRVLVLSLTLAVVLTACSYPDENFAGSEYMPDMAHSLAVEANTYNYYYYNTWDEESTVELAKLVYPRTVPAGTVPRGYAGARAPKSIDEALMMRGSMVDANNMSAISVPTNGSVPYYYDNTPEGRLQAIAELQENPFPITEEGLARGRNLYNIFCGICHGMGGDGLGYLYDEEQNPNAKYPLAPANFMNDEFIAASNGRYYNAIMYGYNAMGAYADKINYEERWQVIHYIREMQAKKQEKEYSPMANTFNASFGTPGSNFESLTGQSIPSTHEVMEEGEHHSDGDDHSGEAAGHSKK